MLSRKPRKRKCAWCSERFQPRQMGQKVCSPPCALAHTRAERARKAHSKPRGKLAKRVKTRSDYIKECQRAFNRYIRARDRLRGHGCISCSDPLTASPKQGGIADCSHYRSVGAAPHLRYNAYNASLACVKCNRWLSGNAVEFRLGLIKRIGLEKVEALEADNTVRRFDVEYLQRLKRVFNRRAVIREKLYSGKRAG